MTFDLRFAALAILGVYALVACLAASHDILEFKRCNCNALKPMRILGRPHRTPTACR